MSEKWIKFVEDPRPICKFGVKCYQKNTQHLETYKHPPQQKHKKGATQRETKRRKIDNLPTATDDDKQTQRCNEKPTNSNVNKTEESSRIASNSDITVTTQVLMTETPHFSHQLNIEYLDLSTSDHKSMIEELFLVQMPSDFYSLWTFLTKEKENGIDIMKIVNLAAVGPYHVLSNTLPRVSNKDDYLIHWRYFYDPPEFQTIIKSVGKGEFHVGYYRDSPDEFPAFVGSNDSSKDCTITPIADNVLGALFLHLQLEKKKSPFTAMSHQKVIDKLKLWAEEHNFSLDKFDARKRIATVAVTKTFHGAGVVVPYDKKTQLGYRPLAESDANLKKILTSLSKCSSSEKKNTILSELQPVITYANIAMDECDFGTGLELGINLFSSGLEELHETILATLTTAYTLLNRQAFITVLQVHLKHRRKGADLSVPY